MPVIEGEILHHTAVIHTGNFLSVVEALADPGDVTTPGTKAPIPLIKNIQKQPTWTLWRGYGIEKRVEMPCTAMKRKYWSPMHALRIFDDGAAIS